MNFYNDLEVYGSTTAIITENSDHFSYADLLEYADELKNQFKKGLLYSVSAKIT